jgi:hypothetical protein
VAQERDCTSCAFGSGQSMCSCDTIVAVENVCSWRAGELAVMVTAGQPILFGRTSPGANHYLERPWARPEHSSDRAGACGYHHERGLADQKAGQSAKTHSKYRSIVQLFEAYLESYWPGHGQDTTRSPGRAARFAGPLALKQSLQAIRNSSAISCPAG